MSLRIIVKRPAIIGVKFSDTDDSSIRKAMQRWGWNRLSEVLECLNEQDRGMTFDAINLVQRFAPLNGHVVGRGAVVTWIGISPDDVVENVSNTDPGEFARRFRSQWDYLIPSGWASRILSSGSASANDKTPDRTIVEVRFDCTEHDKGRGYPELHCFDVRGGFVRKLGIDQSPLISGSNCGGM